jgi:NAD(P)-dependent dehydrogenase (short-subunit alcohol dehydrogenase family)
MELAKGGVRVCTVAPSFIRVDSLKDWMLKCNSYKYRPIGAVIEPIGMLGQDGLYPGQIRPFNEDYLVRSTVIVTAPEPEECDT